MVCDEHPDLFEPMVLTANNRVDELIEQSRKYRPDTVVIGNESLYERLRDALADLPIKVYAGSDSIAQVVTSAEVDVVLTAMVGFSGLLPTINAIKAGKAIALANKETLVVAGEHICGLIDKHKAPILPVDSEHSAIFQCLQGAYGEVEKIILTGSGGPFRKHDAEALKSVTTAQALRHPKWNMGAKITIDSATLMNKGFEVIEAKWLFGIDTDKIEVVIHPESIVHSAVQFTDGGIIAQMGAPDMRLPIQFAFSYPQRLSYSGERISLARLASLTFEQPRHELFPCLTFAYDALHRGGNASCTLNAANEVANLAFREERIGFTQIAETISHAMHHTTWDANPDLQVYIDTDAEARAKASQYIEHLSR